MLFCLLQRDFKTMPSCQQNNLFKLDKNGRNLMLVPAVSLTVCVYHKKIFCFYCRRAESNGLMSVRNKAEPTFTKVGFNNWKKTLHFRSIDLMISVIHIVKLF